MPDEMNHPMGHDDHGHGMPPRKTSILPWAILLIVILAVLIAAVMFRDRIMPKNSANNNNSSAQTASGYDAVFLTNGQVYFGKLSDVSDQYMTLKDIYYLQLVPSDLQGQQQQAANSNQQGQLALRKLGKSGELHGPVDVMRINRDQVLYYQEITEEGSVMKAIRQYQANPNAANAPANSNQQAPANNAPANNAPANTNK